MNDNQWLHLADVAQLLTIGITLSGYFPQLLRLYRTRSGKELSILTWLLWTVGNAMALFYGAVHYLFDHCCLPLVITTGLNFAFCFATTATILWFRTPERRSIRDEANHAESPEAIFADIRV